MAITKLDYELELYFKLKGYNQCQDWRKGTSASGGVSWDQGGINTCVCCHYHQSHVTLETESHKITSCYKKIAAYMVKDMRTFSTVENKYFREMIHACDECVVIHKNNTFSQHITVYPKKYAHGFCFAVLCCGYTLTDFPISIRLTSLALWQSNDCPSASKATLMNMDKYFMWINYERLHNHNKAEHNKTVCIFLGIYHHGTTWMCPISWRIWRLPHILPWLKTAGRQELLCHVIHDHHSPLRRQRVLHEGPCVLQTRVLDEWHTGENISVSLNDALECWHILYQTRSQ